MHLPPATERLWTRLQTAAQLQGFVLIGGTALSLQIGHRLSEDLDFMQAALGPLPRGKLGQLGEQLRATGWELQANPSPALVAEYEDSGKEWSDYQQDYVAHDPDGGSVKLTFVVADPENLRCLDLGPHAGAGPRLATLAELFRLKCIAAADRTKSRDWLDLYLLLRSQRFDHRAFIESFERAAVPQKREIALMRMTLGKLHTNDEGFSALLADTPTLAEMTAFFRNLRDAVEQELACREFLAPGGRPQPDTHG